jgi:3-oxoacyl-[acyl-carrier protein] reductase
MELLKDRIAIVLGGGRGNGAAICRCLAEHGAAVTVVDLEEERAEAVAGSIREAGGEAIAAQGNVLVGAEIEAAVAKTVAERGGLDICVNNVGGMTAHATWAPLPEWPEEAWDSILALNLRYAYLSARAVFEPLKASKDGSIVNISSMSGIVSAPRHAPYGAAKAGLVNLTRSLAVEFGPDGIRVNAIAPGVIATEANEAILPRDQVALVERQLPLRRVGVAADIGKAATFLASDLAGYVTGQVIPVDGGATVTYPIALGATDG